MSPMPLLNWSAAEVLLASASLLLTVVSVFILFIVGLQFRRSGETERKFARKMDRVEGELNASMRGMAHKFDQLVDRITDLVTEMHRIDRQNAVGHERFSALERRVMEMDDKISWVEDRERLFGQRKETERVDGARAG